MSVFAELHDGRRLEFPDGTDTAVIQATVKKVLGIAPDEQAASMEAPQAESPSLIDRLGRQAGLTARAGIEGVTAIPNMVGDALGLKSSQGVSNALTSLGAPVPANATERVVQDIGSAMAGGGGMVTAGKALAKSAKPIISKVGDLLTSQPTLQAVGNATGAGSAGMVREEGGGAGAQTLAALAGGITPAAVRTVLPMATKGLFRGGEAGRQQTADNIKLFQDAGYGTPSAGQATESRFARGVESVLSKTPGSAGRMVAVAEKGANNLGQSVEDVATRLSPNATSTKAGAAIETGIKKFVEKFRATQTALYNKLDQYIAPDTQVPATHVQAKLAELNAPIAGAENTSSLLQTPRMGAIGTALENDIAATGGIPYQALKELRTAIGAKLDNPSLTDDVPTSQWKQLYGALSDDMKEAAQKAGPDAEKAFSRANTFTKLGHKRINTYLDRVAGKDTMEKIFQAAVNPSEIREGASTINAVMRSMDAGSRSIVQSAFIKRLGTATAGNQDAAGEVFSPNTFLTNWNKISPEAKRILFAGQGGQVRSSLDKIAKVADNIRVGSRVFANPSGTQQAISAQAAGGGLFVAVLTGNVGVAAGIAGTAGAANLSARLMTNPDFVKWLAKSTSIPRGTIPIALNQLSQLATKMQPEDQSAIEQFIQATISAAQSQGTAQ